MPIKDISDVKNVGFVLYGIDDIRMEPYPLPKPLKKDEVLLRSLSCGICGTDIHYWKEMALGSIKITKPFILGHEASAEVVGVGDDVKHLKIGDRICTEPLPVCQKCEHCKRLDFNLCVEGQQPSPPFNGALTYYYNHPADFCFKVPDTLSNEEAAMIEPLCVSVHACRRVGVTVGSTVFITGSGPIGLLNMLVARAYGASRIVLTDIKAERLKLAKELGADDTILVSRDMTEEQILVKVKKAFKGDWPTISMESSGVAPNFRLVLLATKPKGDVMLVGMGPTEVLLPIAEASNKEITIHGCFRYANCWDLAIDLAPKLPLAKLISHRFDLKDTQKAFDTAFSGSGMKIMIKIAD